MPDGAAAAVREPDLPQPVQHRERLVKLPFSASLDELWFGVRLPTLPYIPNVPRKFGIDYMDACTDGWDQAALDEEADADLRRSQRHVD